LPQQLGDQFLQRVGCTVVLVARRLVDQRDLAGGGQRRMIFMQLGTRCPGALCSVSEQCGIDDAERDITHMIPAGKNCACRPEGSKIGVPVFSPMLTMT
jgi:hypothetical protein